MRPSNESIAKAFWHFQETIGLTAAMTAVVNRAREIDATAQDVPEVGYLEQHARDSSELRSLCDQRDQARKTSQYWKGEHAAANVEIASLQSQLTETQRELNGARAMLASERTMVEHLEAEVGKLSMLETVNRIECHQQAAVIIQARDAIRQATCYESSLPLEVASKLWSAVEACYKLYPSSVKEAHTSTYTPTITLASIQTGPILTTLEQRSLNKPHPLLRSTVPTDSNAGGDSQDGRHERDRD